MRIVFMGTPGFSVAALTKLHHRHEIAAVYTQPPRPAQRGQQILPSPVHAYAERHNLPVHTPVSLKGAGIPEKFAAHRADVAVVAAYGLILLPPILRAPRLGCVNIHASLLPRWRGAAPIQRAIMAGDTVSGITTMQMDAGLDTGAMLLVRKVSVTDTTTAGELHDALADLGADLVLQTLDGLARGGLVPTPQPAEGVTLAPKIGKAEGHLDFNRPAHDVIRHIHGLSPFPGAWFTHGAERIKVLRAEAAEGRGTPGTVLDGGLTVACKEGAVRLLLVQRAGKGPMAAADFLRGYDLPSGTALA